MTLYIIGNIWGLLHLFWLTLDFVNSTENNLFYFKARVLMIFPNVTEIFAKRPLIWPNTVHDCWNRVLFKPTYALHCSRIMEWLSCHVEWAWSLRKVQNGLYIVLRNFMLWDRVSLSFLPPLNIDSPKSRIEQGHARWSLTLYFETATRIDGWHRISSIEDRSLEDNNRCWKSIWAWKWKKYKRKFCAFFGRV